MTSRPSNPLSIAKRRVRSAFLRQSTKDYARAIKDLQALLHEQMRQQFGAKASTNPKAKAMK